MTCSLDGCCKLCLDTFCSEGEMKRSKDQYNEGKGGRCLDGEEICNQMANQRETDKDLEMLVILICSHLSKWFQQLIHNTYDNNSGEYKKQIPNKKRN